MVYAAGETAWIRAMRSRVRRAADGRAMLVAQGAAAFERWFPGQARTGRGHAGSGQCGASLDRLGAASSLALGCERWLLPRGLSALRRADLRAARATPSSAICAGSGGGRFRTRSAIAAASHRSADLECRLCAGWPEGLSRVRSAVWLDGIRPRRGAPAQVRGVEPRGRGHGRSDARTGAIDGPGILDTDSARRPPAAGSEATIRASGSPQRSAPESASRFAPTCSSGRGRPGPRRR